MCFISYILLFVCYNRTVGQFNHRSFQLFQKTKDYFSLQQIGNRRKIRYM